MQPLANSSSAHIHQLQGAVKTPASMLASFVLHSIPQSRNRWDGSTKDRTNALQFFSHRLSHSLVTSDEGWRVSAGFGCDILTCLGHDPAHHERKRWIASQLPATIRTVVSSVSLPIFPHFLQDWSLFVVQSFRMVSILSIAYSVEGYTRSCRTCSIRSLHERCPNTDAPFAGVRFFRRSQAIVAFDSKWDEIHGGMG